MTETTTTFKPEEEITKLLNTLETDENDIDKISKVTHKCLMVISVRDASIIMNNRKEKKENENDEDEMNLFHELIQKTYLKKIDLMRKELLN